MRDVVRDVMRNVMSSAEDGVESETATPLTGLYRAGDMHL